MYSKQVRFNPWIGKNYGKGSQLRVPLLILGESHYDREGVPENHNFTIELIENYANGFSFKTWRPTFLTKILNTVVGSQGSPTLKDKRAFWDSVAFYSYIQEFVGDNYRQAPTEQMWKDARIPFHEVLEKLEPACIIVISDRLWINMPYANQGSQKVSANGKSTETRIYGSALSGRIHHVSSFGFRPADWHPLVGKLIRKAQASN